MSTLLDHYVALRHLHLTAVGASLALFAGRGIGVLLGAAWPLRPPARWLSVAIDCLLLGAGVSLWAALRLDPIGADRWLGVKLLLLLAYIVLGSLALKRARSPRGRAMAFGLALLCAAQIVGIALAHRPGGWLAG